MISCDDAPDFSFPRDLYVVVAGAFGTTTADAKQRILAAIYGRNGSSRAARTVARDLSGPADPLTSSQNLAEVVETARACLRGGRADFEVLARDFAGALVGVASTCRMGLPCEEHGGVVHGQEAEQLRVGVERIIRSTAMVSEDDAAFVLEASRRSLIFLLDTINARDSLSFREMTDPPEKADTPIVSSGDMRSRSRRSRQHVIAAHRSEGEPRTMARVQGMCDERWPGRSSVAWITLNEPRRHVAVTFPLGSGERIEGAAATWLEAMDAVDAARVHRGMGA